MLLETGFSVHVLAKDQPLTLLGTSLCLQDICGTEVPNRIASSWRLFWALRPLLLNKDVSLHKRMRLFQATVSSCALWCAESWALRATEVRQWRTAQHAMLRRMAGVRRATDESWVEWIQRATDKARGLASASGVHDWAHVYYERKWNWAGLVARRSDITLTYRATSWRDTAWTALAFENGLSIPLRPSRRRWTKYEAIIHNFCTAHGFGKWMEVAEHREVWAARCKDFVTWALNDGGLERVQ